MTEPKVVKPVRNCPVCGHESVDAINTAILNGKSFRSIARNFQIGSNRNGQFKADHHKVSEHARRCLAVAYQQAQQEKLGAQGAAIATRLMEMDGQVDRVLTEAWQGEPLMIGDVQATDPMTGEPVYVRRTGHLRVVLAAVREARHNAELKGKLAGALPDENAGKGAEAARAALADPEARRLAQELEEHLAKIQAEQGQDVLE